MRNKRVEYEGFFVKKEYQAVEEHISMLCNEFIKKLLNDDICKDFIIPDLETQVMGHINCAITEVAIDEAYGDYRERPNDTP